MIEIFPFYYQHDQMDCGPACLVMITSYYGRRYKLQYLRESSFLTKDGVSLLGINEASKKIGFNTFTAKLTVDELYEQKNLFPCILHWNQNHFVVLRKTKQHIFTKKHFFYIADPAHGMIKLSEEKFAASWLSNDNSGVALFLSPTEKFYEKS